MVAAAEAGGGGCVGVASVTSSSTVSRWSDGPVAQLHDHRDGGAEAEQAEAEEDEEELPAHVKEPRPQSACRGGGSRSATGAVRTLAALVRRPKPRLARDQGSVQRSPLWARRPRLV